MPIVYPKNKTVEPKPSRFDGTEYSHYSKFPMQYWRWPYFAPSELASKSDGKFMIDGRSLDRLHNLRVLLGQPIIVYSNYRSAAHNRKVGGAKSSQHLKAKAFDCQMTSGLSDEFRRKAKAVGFTGFGDYPRSGFMHIDTGTPRSWNDGSDREYPYSKPMASKPKSSAISKLLSLFSTRPPNG